MNFLRFVAQHFYFRKAGGQLLLKCFTAAGFMAHAADSAPIGCDCQHSLTGLTVAAPMAECLGFGWFKNSNISFLPERRSSAGTAIR